MSEKDRPPAGSSVAVVGAGLIGMSVAWRLTQAGFAVTLYDKGEFGKEASWAGAGMLAPGGEIQDRSALAELAIEARRQYRSFVRELEHDSGLRIDYQECGALELAYSLEELEALSAKADRQCELGIESRPISALEITTFWPRIAVSNLTGGRFYRDDAVVDPRDVLRALVRVGNTSGVQFRMGTPVRALSVFDHNVAVEAEQSDVFDAVVIAAGAWSGSLQVQGVAPLPASEPVKGHLIGYWQPEQTCNTIVRYGHTYLLQRANGLMIVGASMERIGFDRKIDPRITDTLSREAAAIFPHLEETTPSEAWIGFRPGSESLQVGAWHSPRLYLAYGHYRNGILLAPSTAFSIAAELRANLGRH